MITSPSKQHECSETRARAMKFLELDILYGETFAESPSDNQLRSVGA